MANSAIPRLRRRITLILDTAGSRRALLEILPSLIGESAEIDLDAVLFEDEAQRRAAELPFVRELSLLTTGEREFGTADIERARALCRQGLEQALRVATRGTDIVVTVRSVTAAAGRLQEFASVSDVTVLAPPRGFVQELLSVTGQVRRKGRIVVVVNDFASGSQALSVAGQLARGDMSRLTVISGTTEREQRGPSQVGVIPGMPLASVRRMPDAGIDALLDMLRREAAAMVIFGVNDKTLAVDTLQILRRELRCLMCLVRAANGDSPT